MEFIDTLQAHPVTTTSDSWDSDVSAIVSELAIRHRRRDTTVDSLKQRRYFRRDSRARRTAEIRDIYPSRVAFMPGPYERRRRAESHPME